MRLHLPIRIILLSTLLIPISFSKSFVLSQVARPSLFSQSLSARFRQVTVKVQIGDTWGSGVIVARRGSFYWVLTNQHVLDAGKNYCVRSYNNKSYAATAIKTKALNGLDAGLLVFYSKKDAYPTQSLSRRPHSSPGTQVLAVGYPFILEDNKHSTYVALPGEIKIVLKTPLKDGFAIAYSSPVVKGMSGGGIFNAQGELVGINGIHAYPLWEGDYKYIDGRNLTTELNQQLQTLSIGIPTSTVFEGIQNAKLSTPKLSSLSCSIK